MRRGQKKKRKKKKESYNVSDQRKRSCSLVLSDLWNVSTFWPRTMTIPIAPIIDRSCACLRSTPYCVSKSASLPLACL